MTAHTEREGLRLEVAELRRERDQLARDLIRADNRVRRLQGSGGNAVSQKPASDDEKKRDMVDKADAWDCSVAGSRASYQRGRLAGLDEGIAERDALRTEVRDTALEQAENALRRRAHDLSSAGVSGPMGHWLDAAFLIAEMRRGKL